MNETKLGFVSHRSVRIAVFGSIGLALAGTCAAQTDDFPHIGLLSLEGAQKYAAPFQAYASKFQMVVIGGDWEGWEQGAGYSKEQVISSIKTQSYVNTRVFQYVSLHALYSSASQNRFPTWYAQVSAMNWWLHPSTTVDTPVADPSNSAQSLVDMGPNVPVDPATALGPYEWAAKFVSDLFRLGAYSGTSASVSLDGFFVDNVLIDPAGADGDWLRIGSTQAHDDPTTYETLMAGQKSFYAYLSTAWPGSINLGNAGGTFGGAVSNKYAATDPTLNDQILAGTSTLSGALQGGDFEHTLGKSYSVETWGGSEAMQAQYRTAMLNFSGAKLMLFHHDNVQADGSDPVTFSGSTPATWSPAWQGARYGITATLMNDGYYYATGSDYDQETPDNHRWFDEYDNAGARVGYLGQPVSGSLGAPQSAAWSNGVWMREFAGGVVLWNPKGNGTQTVDVSGLVSPSGHAGVQHIAGTQDTVTNNGQVATTVTLGDRDGVILLWVTP